MGMRALFIGLMLAGGPALAQSQTATPAALDQRLRAIETDLRALKKQVLPTGTQRLIEPEVDTSAPPPPAPVAANPGGGIADLAERLSAIERAQRTLTASVEEQGERLRRLEAANTKLREDVEFRLGRLENPGAAAPAATTAAATTTVAPGAAGRPPGFLETVTPKPAPSGAQPAAATPSATMPKPATTAAAKPVAPAPKPAATAAAAPPATADAAWTQAQALLDAKDWPAAETALAAFITKYPKDRRISQARYWLGRSYFSQNRFEESARAHTANYEQNPRGDRAQESLYWVGQSLVRLGRRPAACQVYDLAGRVYADEMKPELKPQFATARTNAGCS